MTRLLLPGLAAAAALALGACGGSGTPAGPDAGGPQETVCSDQTDNDGDGATDCEDVDCHVYAECTPPAPRACSKQRDCGNIVDEIVTKVCLSGKCQPPGAATYMGEAVTAQVSFDLTFKSTLTGTTKPKTVSIRFVHPTRVDGSTLTCADVVGTLAANTKNCVDQSTRSRLDADATLNQVFRSLYPVDLGGCSGTECQFTNMIATVPRGQGYLLYGEAWYGPRDPNDLNNPTGICAAYTCLEGQSVSANDQRFRLTFSAQ